MGMGSSDACFTYQALVNNPYPLESVRAEFESICRSDQVPFLVLTYWQLPHYAVY